MSWLVFLGILTVSINNFCKVDLECKDHMQDCVLDGENFDWCKNEYK